MSLSLEIISFSFVDNVDIPYSLDNHYDFANIFAANLYNCFYREGGLVVVGGEMCWVYNPLLKRGNSYPKIGSRNSLNTTQINKNVAKK